MGAVALLVLLGGVATGRGPAVGGPDGALPRRVRAQALLAEGKHEEALGEATIGLEYAPENIDLLDLASRAAEKLDRRDEALLRARLALDLAREVPDRRTLAVDLARRIAGLDPLESKGAALLEECAAANFRLAEMCAARALPLNAIDLYLRSLGTAFDARARAALDRLYGNPKTVPALLEAGPDLPLRAPLRVPAGKAAEEDMSHFTWEAAWQIRSARTTVVSNLPREEAEAVSGAMEQMVRFYGTVLRRPERGDPPTLTLRVYSSAGQYEEFETSRPAAAPGFYSPSGSYVATFHPLWKAQPRPGLWRTLFREGARAFLPRATGKAAPAWVEEGTALYFEGARVHRNGWVETNLVPGTRLLETARALEAGKPALKEVVSLVGGGERPAEFGSLAWALVYFLLNFEDDRSERSYRPLHAEFLESVRAGATSDPFERFVSTFVKKARRPGVETFEDFVGRFEEWIVALQETHGGTSSSADRLLERARKQRGDGKREAAIESCRFALAKRPEDPGALFELAEVEGEVRRKDAALLHLRRALAVVAGKGAPASRPADEEGALEDCLARIQGLDKPLADGLREQWTTRRDRAAEVARVYAEAGYPREALRVLDAVQRALGPDPGLLAIRKQLAGSTGVDPRPWRRLRLGPELDSWEWGGYQKATSDGILLEFDRSNSVFYRHAIPDPYRFEATLVPVEPDRACAAALLFGRHGETGSLSFAFGAKGQVAVFRYGEAGPKAVRPLKTPSWDRRKPLRLAIDVSEGGAEFFADDLSIGRIPLTPSERVGRIGLVVEEGKVEFRDIRARW
jgi:tetratricopeptide (TPR) repeat protein